VTGATHASIELLRDGSAKAIVVHAGRWLTAPVPPELRVQTALASADGAVLGSLEVCFDETPPPSARSTLADIAALAAAAIESARARAGQYRDSRHASRLQELTAALSEAVTLSEVTQAVVHHIREAFDADGAVVARCTEDGRDLEILDVAGMAQPDGSECQTFPLSTDAPLAEAARNAQPIFLESRREWFARYPHLRDVVEATGHHANAVLPLVVQGRPVGSIGITFRQSHSFDAEDRMLAWSIARQCALALDRARLFESEQAARLRAEAANASKSEFVAVMSHELRTPLNAISGYTELMMMGIHGPLTSEQREDLERIQRSQRHLLALINNLLDYAKIEGGRLRVLREDVDVLEVIEGVIAIATPQLRAKGLRGSCVVPRRLQLRGDAGKVGQILLNLVANAVKFTPRGGTIRIEAQSVDDRVEIHVTDSGIGVPTDMADAIFEPFVQLNSPLTSHASGTGLGLAISRDLARLMDGTLTMTAGLPHGARFTIVLPASSEAAAPAAEDTIEREF
jgi:signal transduction histidine kinase